MIQKEIKNMKGKRIGYQVELTDFNFTNWLNERDMI